MREESTIVSSAWVLLISAPSLDPVLSILSTYIIGKETLLALPSFSLARTLSLSLSLLRSPAAGLLPPLVGFSNDDQEGEGRGLYMRRGSHNTPKTVQECPEHHSETTLSFRMHPPLSGAHTSAAIHGGERGKTPPPVPGEYFSYVWALGDGERHCYGRPSNPGSKLQYTPRIKDRTGSDGRYINPRISILPSRS